MAGLATCLLCRAQVALCIYAEHLQVYLAPTLPPSQAWHQVTVAEVARALTLAASPSPSLTLADSPSTTLTLAASPSTTLQSILVMEEESILGLQSSEDVEASEEDIAEDQMEFDDETDIKDGAVGRAPLARRVQLEQVQGEVQEQVLLEEEQVQEQALLEEEQMQEQVLLEEEVQELEQVLLEEKEVQGQVLLEEEEEVQGQVLLEEEEEVQEQVLLEHSYFRREEAAQCTNAGLQL